MRGAGAADGPWQGYRQKFRVFFREAGIGIDLKHAGHGTDTQTFRQRAHRPYQLLGRYALAMQGRAMGLLEIAITARAIQLAPRSTARMTIGTEIPQSHPALIGTVRMRAEMLRGIHLARSSSRGDHAGWPATGRLGCVLVGLLTGSTEGLRVRPGNGGGSLERLHGGGRGLDGL